MNPHAPALGKLGAGVKRKLSPEEIERRTERIKKAQRIRAERMRKQKGLE